MILKIELWQKLDKERELSFHSEVVVDGMSEAHDHGREFHDVIVAFTNGYAERATEVEEDTT